MKNKKGQEEIAGFAIIVVIIMIVAVIFLSISLNNESTGDYSIEVSSYLKGLKEYTTSCTLQGSAPANIRSLLIACKDKKICDNGQLSCAFLNETLSEILSTTLPVGNNSRIKGYHFTANVLSNSSQESRLIEINKGSCPSSYIQADEFLITPTGRIRYYLKRCY
jgi:hypothetical protein